MQHFLASFQNPWKLDAIWEASKLLEMASKPSWLDTCQFFPKIQKYEWAIIILVEANLEPKVEHYRS